MQPLIQNKNKLRALKTQLFKQKFQWQLKKGYAIWQSGCVDLLNNNGLAGLFDTLLQESKNKASFLNWLELGQCYPHSKSAPKELTSPRIEAKERKTAQLKNQCDLLKKQVAQDKRRLRDRFLRDLGGLFEEMGGDTLFGQEPDQKKCEQLLFGALLSKVHELNQASDETKHHLIKQWKERGDALFKKKQKRGPPLIVLFKKEPPLRTKQLLKKEFRAHYNPVRREWYAYGELALLKKTLIGLDANITAAPP